MELYIMMIKIVQRFKNIINISLITMIFKGYSGSEGNIMKIEMKKQFWKICTGSRWSRRGHHLVLLPTLSLSRTGM